MTPFVSRVASRAAALVLLAACAETPPLHLHTLLPSDTAAAHAPAGPSLLLGPITVPPAVDEARWLVRMPDGSLSRLENERWASSLPDELRAAVLEVLAARHGVVDARSPGAPPAQWQLRVDITRFDTASDGDVREEGIWALMPAASAGAAAPGDRAVVRCTFASRESAGAGATALADAHRRAVVHLGDAIGAAVVAASHGQPPACPA